jgi:carboxymethylenebutenolidase
LDFVKDRPKRRGERCFSAAPARPHLRPANGKLAVIGFSWGGWKSFAYATHRKDLNAVFVFYGTGAAISAPVYGFYAGEDAGVDVL